MGYKRKAHIVFLSESASLAAMAEGFANSIGAEWMEARAAALSPATLDALTVQVMAEAGIEIAQKQFQLPIEPLLQWADLLVTLDAESEGHCPPLPPGVQKRHYPFPVLEADDDLTGCRVLRDKVKARVEGMVGGMKLLEKAARE